MIGHGIPMPAPSAASIGGGGPATTRNPLVDLLHSQKSKDHLRNDDQAFAQFSNSPFNAQSANLSADGTYAGQTSMDVLRILQSGMAGAQNQNPAGVLLDDRKVKLISEAKDANVILMMRRFFLQKKQAGKIEPAVVAAYMEKLDARSVEFSNMPSSVPPPSGVDAATAATLDRGQARGAGSSGGARDAGSAGDARGGWASLAT